MELKNQWEMFATWIRAHVKTDKGASLVEYALLLALIAVLCIAAISLVGGNAKSKLNSVGSSIGA
ncbi:MAG: Flp family type IVb pilin [Acidimicrobiia bacterium]